MELLYVEVLWITFFASNQLSQIFLNKFLEQTIFMYQLIINHIDSRLVIGKCTISYDFVRQDLSCSLHE